MKLVRNEKLLFAAKRINLDISEISYGYLDDEWNNENLCAAFTRVYIPIKGEGQLCFGGRRMRLLPGRIYVVPSGLEFSSECADRLEKIYVHLILTRPDGGDLFSELGEVVELQGMERRVERIRALYKEPTLEAVLQLKTVLYEVLIEALSQHPTSAPPLVPYSRTVQMALSYIDAHLSAHLRIDEIAAALFVSSMALQRRFKREVGRPIGRYIDESLMTRAERVLLESARSIREISEELGYCDQFYFSRCFTAAHGIGPRAFRLAHRV